MIKKIIAGAVAFSALTMAMPASASIYTLNMDNGSTVSVDTAKMVGSWIGAGINATFSGAGLANFTTAVPEGSAGLPSADYVIKLDSTSTFQGANGTTYFPTNVHEQHFKTGVASGLGAFSVLLWSWWGPAGCTTCTDIGDYTGRAASWSVATSSGGTDVPEPGMIGLMGLGALGLAFARRRRAKVSLNMARLGV